MLEKLKLRLKKIIEEMRGLNDLVVEKSGVVRKFTEDEDSRYKALEVERDEVRSAIEREKKRLEDQALIDDLDTSNEAPTAEVVVTREDKHNDAGEFRGYADVEHGGLGDFLRDVSAQGRGLQTSATFRAMQQSFRAATGLNTQVGATAGSLIQSDHAENLSSQIKDSNAILTKCTDVELEGNNISINMVDESSVAIGSQFGGIKAHWKKEGNAVAPTMPKFREVSAKLGTLEALMYATEDQLEDTTQLGSLAQTAYPLVMGYQLLDAVFNGDGAIQPLGIINAPCTITVSKEDGQAAGTFLYANMDNMVDRLLVDAEEDAEIYIHPSMRQKLRNIYATPGTKTDFMPFLMAGGGKDRQIVDPINGFPIRRVQQCKQPGKKGDIIIANMKYYYLFKKKGIRATESMHVAFLTGEKVFKWTMRAHGMPMFNKPITDANGSGTRAPFIVLEERA